MSEHKVELWATRLNILSAIPWLDIGRGTEVSGVQHTEDLTSCATMFLPVIMPGAFLATEAILLGNIDSLKCHISLGYTAPAG